METAIQKLAVLNLLIIGVSHVLQPRAWVMFFIWVRALGEPGSFVVAFPSLLMGSLIVSFHNVWSGLPIVLTILGWGTLFKATLYLAYSKWGMRMLNRVSVDRSREFVIAGLVLIILAVSIALPLLPLG